MGTIQLSGVGRTFKSTAAVSDIDLIIEDAAAQITESTGAPSMSASCVITGGSWCCGSPRAAHSTRIGGVLDDDVIDALAARAVCGPANNPLAERSGADRLAARGILYAPDFVVNAGGVVYLDLEAKHLGTRAEIMDRVAGIGDTLRDIFAAAAARGITPLAAAEERAAERLSAGQLAGASA